MGEKARVSKKILFLRPLRLPVKNRETLDRKSSITIRGILSQLFFDTTIINLNRSTAVGTLAAITDSLLSAAPVHE